MQGGEYLPTHDTILVKPSCGFTCHMLHGIKYGTASVEHINVKHDNLKRAESLTWSDTRLALNWLIALIILLSQITAFQIYSVDVAVHGHSDTQIMERYSTTAADFRCGWMSQTISQEQKRPCSRL